MNTATTASNMILSLNCAKGESTTFAVLTFVLRNPQYFIHKLGRDYPAEHAIVAPFLKEKWGWTDTDICWWCNRGRQSREHLFKECTAWTKEMGSGRGGLRGTCRG